MPESPWDVTPLNLFESLPEPRWVDLQKMAGDDINKAIQLYDTDPERIRLEKRGFWEDDSFIVWTTEFSPGYNRQLHEELYPEFYGKFDPTLYPELYK